MWSGTGQLYRQDPAGTSDLRPYLSADSALEFDVIVHRPPAGRVVISSHCVHPCFTEVVATSLFEQSLFEQSPVGRKTTVKIPVSCFDAGGFDLGNVDTPLLVHTESAFDASFANVRLGARRGKDPDVAPCP